jgi:hypothetical protein
VEEIERNKALRMEKERWNKKTASGKTKRKENAEKRRMKEKRKDRKQQ